MKEARRAFVAAVAVVCIAALPVFGTGYVEAVSWATMNSPAPGTSSQHYGWVTEGTTSYHQLGTGGNSRITKVTNYDTAPVATELLSQAAWAAASGKTSITGFYGFGMVGNNLQFGESGTDGIWRVDTTTGVVSSYVSKAQIMAYTGETSASLYTTSTQSPTGEQVFREGTHDAILMTTGPGTLTTLITEAELIALMGNNSPSGGFGYSTAGEFYFADTTTDEVYKRSVGGVLSTVLTGADIMAVTGYTAVGFGDIYGMSNGDVIFYDSSADSIMRFDPTDPANTLSVVINDLDLIAGPAGSDSVFELGELDGMVAWNNNSTGKGLYVIPEPATLSLLVLGGLLLRRRR